MPGRRQLNFVSAAECAEVAAWALDSATMSQMISLKNEGDRADGVINRMTVGLTGTKYTEHLHKFDNRPAIVDVIRDRLMALDPPYLFTGKREWISRVIVHNASTDTTTHDDRTNAPNHFRANIVCQAPTAGGLFKIGGRSVPVAEGELIVFNANEPHTLEAITEGQRVILTFGWKM